ncbi:carboxypeptidase regulatory-like domain-containing protein [Roseivirga sp.]|uniref:carboxypeptidase regulatory-like domain-containing protein n=1 Tax=Roseivirga sp. TaxID=1964215 RepID=UPI002B26BAAE|nr:carboxypeptidase regulatory-like domain-containing protein [Roseivirga sp.]
MKSVLITLTLIFGTFFTPSEEPDQIFNTKLKITILDELGNIVEGAKVTIYKSEADYNAEINAVQEAQLTNNKGQVTFKKLDAIPYYVIARKGDMDNSGGGEVVSKLEKKKLNKANVVISDGV